MDRMDHYYQNTYLKEKRFKISAVFGEDFLNLTIFESGSAWHTNISKEEIIKQSKDLNFEEYYDNLKRYLRSCPQDVKFDFVQGKFTINVLLKNNMEILYFFSVLQEVDFVENIFFLVEKIYNDKIQCVEQLKKLEKQCEYFQKENINYKEKIDVFIERKKTEEQQQYSKFIAVLNEKKQHIQHLTNLLIAFRKGRPTINQTVNKGKNVNQSKKSISTKKNTVVSEFEDSSSSILSDDNYNYNTDNEEVGKTNQSDNICPIPTTIAIATTSTFKTSFLEDDAPPTVFPVSRQNRAYTNLDVQLPQQTSIEEANKRDTEMYVDNKASNGLSPTVTFNTQDLLDNL